MIYIHFDLMGNPSKYKVSKVDGIVFSQLVILFSWISSVPVLYILRSWEEKSKGWLAFVICLVLFTLIISISIIGLFYYNAYGTPLLRPLWLAIVAVVAVLAFSLYIVKLTNNN